MKSFEANSGQGREVFRKTILLARGKLMELLPQLQPSSF
jgi:hypothetical protein